MLFFFSFVARQWIFEEVWSELQDLLLHSSLSFLLFSFDNGRALIKLGCGLCAFFFVLGGGQCIATCISEAIHGSSETPNNSLLVLLHPFQHSLYVSYLSFRLKQPFFGVHPAASIMRSHLMSYDPRRMGM